MAKEHKIGCLFLFFCFVSTAFAASCQKLSILQSTSGTINGPGYPGSYPNNVVRCWRIYAPSGYVVRLDISPSLRMEVCSGCTCDSVEVFNSYSGNDISRRIGKFCSRSWKITSTGQYLFVKFTSDASRSGTAFTASYQRLAKDVNSPPDDGGDGNNDNDNNNNNNNYNNNYNNNNNNVYVNDNNKKDEDGDSDIQKLGSAIGGGIGAVFSIIFLVCIYFMCCGG